MPRTLPTAGWAFCRPPCFADGAAHAARSWPRPFCRSRRPGAEAATLDPTPSQTEGPFYPKTLPVDRDADLTQVAGRAAKASGTPLYFGGRALARDGRPACQARPSSSGNATSTAAITTPATTAIRRDDNFQGYGVAITDGEGRYAFKTIRPVPYTGRPPHLHVRVRPAERSHADDADLHRGRCRGPAIRCWQRSPKGTLALLSMSLAPASRAGRRTRSQEPSISCCGRGARARDAPAACRSAQWIVALERNVSSAPDFSR